jgi:hypothetical protein
MDIGNQTSMTLSSVQAVRNMNEKPRKPPEKRINIIKVM